MMKAVSHSHSQDEIGRVLLLLFITIIIVDSVTQGIREKLSQTAYLCLT